MTTDVRDYYARQPEFLGTTVVEIDVPSGRLIASDDLRSVNHFDIDTPMSINYGIGLDAWAKEYEKVGVAYAFVGNTCPRITRQADGSLQVVTPAWNEEADKTVFEEGETVVADICTDLWATMLTDYQGWLDHGGPDVDTANAPYQVQSFTVIEVTPGRYRWTVYSHSDRFDRDAEGRILFAKLELITE